MAAAEAALAAHDARSALTAAQATSDTAQQLASAIEQYRNVRSEIVRLRGAAEALEARGYRMDASHAALNDARAALAAAAQAFQRGELAAGPLDTARHALEVAQANGQGLVTLQEQNGARLAALKQRGDATAALITQGRTAFDLVDEFAESTWSDIRGNGSEAQRAADEAHDAWDSANARNMMEQQAFAAARDDLNSAEGLLDRATQLVNAILQRLKDLEAARANAAAEIAAARADIVAGQAFIRANNADISAAPEQLLGRAQSQLAAAEAEAARPKPDWLALLREAQAANAAADTALANARGEAATIAKLRGEGERARQAAAAEVQKTAQFFDIHSNDLRQQARVAVTGLQQQLAEAEAAAQQAEAAEDQARAAALGAAVAGFARVDQQAERVYGEIFNEFSQIDKLRGVLERERGRARNALSEAEAMLRSYGAGSSEAVRLIERTHATLQRLPARIEGEESLRAAIATLEKANNDARSASAIIRAQAPPSSSGGGDLGSAIGGAVLGALIEGALSGGGGGGSHHRPSGSSGSGEPRWGGSGSSAGGSFGGGSSSGGGWGGGSSSGGGW